MVYNHPKITQANNQAFQAHKALNKVTIYSSHLIPMSNHAKQNISGVLLFDKTVGDSSNKALQKIKRAFNAKKVGHTGTLDPLASGLLPLMFGQATKFASSLLGADKTYQATVHLGYKSTTGDAEGELLAADTAPEQLDLTPEKLNQVANEMIGQHEQLPPMFSAIKHQGKALYEYARQGIEIERKARTVTIHDFKLLKFEHIGGKWLVQFEVQCSKGTYVRTLAEMFANRLGTEGYLTALRRTAIAQLNLNCALTLDQIESKAHNSDDLQELLLPTDSLLTHLNSKQLLPGIAQRFIQGQRILLDYEQDPPGRSRIYCQTECGESQFLGTGILEIYGQQLLLRPERVIWENL